MIHAVKGGHLEVAKALLKKYADVDVQGEVCSSLDRADVISSAYIVADQCSELAYMIVVAGQQLTSMKCDC